MGQLTRDERYQIWVLRKAGNSMSAVARELGRHKSTISREVNRNSGGRGYRPKQAHQKARARRELPRKPRRITGAIEETVRERLALQHSPEQIAGRLKYEDHVQLSHECIYQYIQADKQGGGHLYKHLRRSSRKRKKRFGAPSRQGQIPDRVPIEERPRQAAVRSRKGDWEGDTVIGRSHRGALVTLVDRKSRYVLIEKVNRRTKEAVSGVINRRLKGLPAHTLTVDNGREFAGHQQWDVAAYFCNAYHSWERGTNENTNGLIRQYFPKKSDFTLLDQEEVLAVQDLLNHRPRKCLGFKTPHEVLVIGRYIRYLSKSRGAVLGSTPAPTSNETHSRRAGAREPPGKTIVAFGI